MRIIHLSDFHLNKKSEYEYDEFLIDALIKDLEERNREEAIELIILSGDLIDKGGESYGGALQAFDRFKEKVISPLTDNLNLGKDRIYFVVGNHDIERHLDSEIIESGTRQSLVTIEKINSFLDENKETLSSQLKRISAFKKFESKFYDDVNVEKQISNFDSNFKIQIGNKTAGISCLNSAWRCYSDADKSNLILGEKQVINAKNFVKGCDIKLLIFHHPIDWLLDIDRRNVEPIITDEFDLLFNGHVHSTNTRISIDFYGKLFISVASGNIGKEIRSDSREFSPAYTIIDYNDIEKNVTSIFRRYNHPSRRFVLNTDKGDEGKKVFPIPSPHDLSVYQKETKVLEDLINDKVNELNTHLISYGTDSISPKSLDEIFVLPDIIDRPNYDPDEEEQTYDLDYFINEDENFIIFGRKEAGKTILLDKIAIELTKRYNQVKKFPVYVNFKEIKNREIISFVRQYLLVNNNDAKDLLENNRIIILLDNMFFDDSYKHVLVKLLHFIDTYPNIKLIATSEHFLTNAMPTEFLEYPKLGFTPKFIQSFDGKQVRELIERWFRDKKGQDFYDNLEKLIDNFRSFELPRTPLSISIFLWIIEKQEFSPINKSTLLETFIEGILEKLRAKEFLSSTFDYGNKIRMLSSIAEFMLSKENANYNVHYNELNNYIHDYLKEIGIEKVYSSMTILDDFINSTILNKDSNNCISFRFPCFFEFFLAQQMTFEKTFFEKVLSEENYLDYINEINYFTGINRGEEEILKVILERTKKIFHELNRDIEPNKIDAFFENKNSFFANHNITELKKKKPTEKEINEYYDRQIKALPVAETIPKKVKSKQREEFYNSLRLVSYVLKNSEEVRNVALKREAYNHIIKSSISLLVLFKIRILDYVIKYKKNPEFLPENLGIGFFLRILPIINQITLYDWLGTIKLEQIILEKIEMDKKDLSISEMEKFLSIFIYADIRAKKYLKIIKGFSKKVKKNYLKDLSFFKVLSYYYLRTQINRELEKEYLNILGDLKVKAMGASKIKKGEIIYNIRKHKEGRKKKNK